LEGRQELARHRRSYDRRQLLLDPAHQQALLQEKRKAIGSTPGGRLVQAVPESRALLDAAFTRGESAGSQTAQLLKLLDTYGPGELRDAIREALEHGRPRASSVAFLLRKHQRSRERLARVPVVVWSVRLRVAVNAPGVRDRLLPRAGLRHRGAVVGAGAEI
jgi:hypothetical protein